MSLFTRDYGLTALGPDPASAPSGKDPEAVASSGAPPELGGMSRGGAPTLETSLGGPRPTLTRGPTTTASRTPSIGVTTTRTPSRTPSLDAGYGRTPPPSLSSVPGRTPSLPGRSPTSTTSTNGKVPMSDCSCEINGRLDISRVIDLVGGRQPTALANNVVLPSVMAQDDVAATGTTLVDLLSGDVWFKDAQVQRVIGGSFDNKLWGMYITSCVVVISGLAELLNGTADYNKKLEATFRSVQIQVTPRSAAPIAYTMTGGVGISRSGIASSLTAAASPSPAFGPETYYLPSPVAFKANEVEVARIAYDPEGDTNAFTIAQLNAAGCYVNAYFGGMMWKDDGSVIPPKNVECQPIDFTAPVRLKSGTLFNIPR